MDDSRKNTKDQTEEYHYQPEQPQKGLRALSVILLLLAIFAVIGGTAAFLLYNNMIPGINLNPNKPTVPAQTLPAATQTATDEIMEELTEAPVTEQTSEVFEVYVPDVEGLAVSEAYKQLNHSDVKFSVYREYSDTIAAEHVISQDPPAGTLIYNTQKVVLCVSKGIDKTDASTSKSTKKKGNSSSSQVSQAQPRGTNGFVFADSDSRYLSKSELTNLSKDELTIALNEIYARHGRRFASSELQSYFDKQSWYNGTISPSAFSESVLNHYELSNVSLIVTVMQQLGYR